MYSLLSRILKRLRPPGGWAPFLLVLVALLSPVAALVESDLDVETVGLLILTPLGLIGGLLLARSRLSATKAAVLGGLLGIILVPTVVGKLLPPLSLLWNEAGYTLEWLGLWQRGQPGWPLPFAATIEYLAQRLYALGVRLWWWSQTASAGGPAQDDIISVLITTSMAWASSLFAAWHIYRRHSALVGLLPAGLAVTTAAFFRGKMAAFYLLVYLFCTLWIMAVCSLWKQLQRWDRSGTDYPGNLGQELIITLGPWLTILIVVAFLFPVIRPQQISDAFWRLADGPWAVVEQVSDRLFGPMEGGFPGASVGGMADGSLPRSHLLGAGPELSETLVLYVKTSDPPPPSPEPEAPEVAVAQSPRRYWRGVTYDVYTGQGWDNSPLERRTSSPDSSLAPDLAGLTLTGQSLARGSELVQNFDLVAVTGFWVFAVNEPLRVDHPVETWWRAPGDLAQVTGDPERYTVISSPLEPTVTDLRAAPDTIPPDIAERYLALPETIPQRVLDLTAEVVGDAESTYDRARTIEAFLRTYTYTLELPTPPSDRDLVDYFLFDVQEGYCDYYASAMVVMARIAGVPARLASGYAQGTYDHEGERWVVLEKDGHSWVEIYFDGIGWVEFEPTAGQPGLTRPGGEDLAGLQVLPLPPRSPGVRFPWPLLVLGGLLVFLVAVVAAIWFWLPRQRQQATAAELVRNRQARLLRWGARLGHPLRDGQTPHEYGATLSDAVQVRGQDARWAPVRRASLEAPSDVKNLSETFTRVQYSSEPLTAREGPRIHKLWTRLRRYLWWLWLGKR